MSHNFILALGSNWGHKLHNLQEAVEHLKAVLSNVRTSIILETAALLSKDAPKKWDIPYLNMVVVGQSTLQPEALLQAIKSIEQAMGRTESERWAPRVIDIDILEWSGTPVQSDHLIIPHPELPNRPFLRSLMATLGVGPIEYMARNQYPEPTKAYSIAPKLVGIVNVTPDSFSDGDRYLTANAAILQVKKLLAEGATVIELGAQSTGPGAVPIYASAEWRRLEPVLQALKDIIPPSTPISIDTYYEQVIRQAYIMGLTNPLWLNDVSGFGDHNILKAAADINCPLVLVHSLSVPADHDHMLPADADPIDQLLTWGEAKLKLAADYGVARENIIFDPGIGFGKSAYQSITILSHINRLKELGCKLLIGHSRKSFMKVFTSLAPEQRDQETAYISMLLANQGVDYLRVHNVEATMRALIAQAMLR